MSAPESEPQQPEQAPAPLPQVEVVGTDTQDASAAIEESSVKLECDEPSQDVKKEHGVVEETIKPEEAMESNEASEEVKEENGTNEIDTKDIDDAAQPIKSESPRNERKPRGPRTYQDGDLKGVLKTSTQLVEGENNSKYDPSVLPETDDPKKIRAQVEFYFGDTNLPCDNFMWKLTDGETNLPVSVEKICSFGRMKRFKPISAVVAALKESKFLEVVGEEGQEQVKRKVPYDPSTSQTSKAESRSIYAKGFGDEEPSSQFDIEAFFAPYGPTNAVRLRRTPEKLFKGSVFVEFADDETAQKFLDLDPKPLWRGKHELKVMSKKAYTDFKLQEIKDGKIEPMGHRQPYGNRGGGRGRGNRGRGGNRGGDRNRGDRGDADDWKKRREEDRASGFKDDRRNNRNDRDRKGGRGGRRGRDDRGPRKNDRNSERAEKKESKSEIKSEDAPSNEKKETHDNDTSIKKNEVKSESTDAPIEASKKRAREDDGAANEGGPSKKEKIEGSSGVAVEAS